MERVAFAVPLRAGQASTVEELAGKVLSDPSLSEISRGFGLEFVVAWIQEGLAPFIVVYMEWLTDPVEGLSAYELSPESLPGLVRGVLRTSATSPEEAELDSTARRAELVFDWSHPSGERGPVMTGRARKVTQDRALAVRDYLDRISGEPALAQIHTRLRDRAGYKRISVWEETTVSGEHLLIVISEADEPDAAVKVADSGFQLDREAAALADKALDWDLRDLPPVREIYRWRASDPDPMG